MNAMLVTTMIVIANVMGAGMAFPQAARLVTTRNTDGVSGVWAGVSFSMNLWWLAYGLANGLWGLVPVSVIAAVIYAVIIVAYVRMTGGAAIRPLAVGSLALGMAPLPALLLGGWAFAGIAIGLCYGIQLVPAVAAAFRTRVLDGIAPATWIMAWVESAIWLVYGAFVVDGALLVGGASGTLMASVIIVRLAATGHEPFRLRRPALALG